MLKITSSLLALGLMLSSLAFAPKAVFADWKHKKGSCATPAYQPRGPHRMPYDPYVNRDRSNYDRSYHNSDYRHDRGGTRKPYYDPISYGISSGRLSSREVQDIREDQRDLYRQERAYKADGVLSRKEQQKLWDSRQDFREDLNHNLYDGERRW